MLLSDYPFIKEEKFISNDKFFFRKFAQSKIILTFAPQLRTKQLQNMLETTGEMAEWSIAAVLKTVELRGSGGSNPSLSAERTGQNRTTNGQVPQIQ